MRSLGHRRSLMVLGAVAMVIVLVASYYIVPTWFGPEAAPGLRAD